MKVEQPLIECIHEMCEQKMINSISCDSEDLEIFLHPSLFDSLKKEIHNIINAVNMPKDSVRGYSEWYTYQYMGYKITVKSTDGDFRFINNDDTFLFFEILYNKLTK